MLIAGTQEFMLFSLILMRMSGFIFLNPILGRRNIPAVVKSGLALLLAVTVFSTATGNLPDIGTPIEYGVLLLKEFAVGFLMGMIMNLFSFAVTYAGSITDFQMALGMASVYDAQSGIQVALTGNILNVYFMLLFFALDGHLALMEIIITSGDLLPYGHIFLSPDASRLILDIFWDCVILAVKLALPIVGSVLILDAGVGILMKIIPSINLFIIDIPIKILLGFLLLMLLTSPIGDYLGDIISEMLKAVQHSLTTVVQQ